MAMRIVHIVAGLWKDTGGPAEVIPNLCRAQSEAGAKVVLCSIDGDTAPQVKELMDTNVEVHLFKSVNNTVRYAPEMAKFVGSLHGADIIHNHGHWLWPNWFAASASRRLGAQFVTTPHGTLVPGMLSNSRLKKRIAWSLFDQRLIVRADLIHALSEAEREAMAPKLGRYADKVRVVPNGVHLAKGGGQHTANIGGTLLFLSRVTPIKGVKQLLNAWIKLTPRFPEWRLKIVGPLDESIRHEVKSLSALAPRVELVGPIYHDARWEEYRNAAAFILPTLGEGLPTVLLEAAAHQLPVITTPEANFDELNKAGGSLLCSPTPSGIQTALTHFFEMSGEERSVIGLNGARLIEEQYEWQAIASNWLSIYSQIRGSEGKLS